jgi:hypothetical protein
VDTGYGTDRAEMKGPGMTSPGDVAMAILLGDHGYSTRLVIDSMLATSNPLNERDSLLQPADPAFGIGLLIVSGSSSSADVPEPPEGIPVMMGEHVTLGNNGGRPGSVYLYSGTDSSDPNESQDATRFMRVLQPDHPIFKGIPLDPEGRVKIFREPTPSEEAHVPAGGFRNHEYRWCTQNAADAAVGTVVLGVLDTDPARACFAVAEAGAMLANGAPAGARLVHLFVNENGSGGSRRVFLSLTEIGRVLFVRAAQWAMGESLPPYDAIRITEVGSPAPGRLVVEWNASAMFHYEIRASRDLVTWQPVIEDIAGTDGLLRQSLVIGPGETTVFLRVTAMP